jgi:threonine dehydrogenase-like Zn-dependent dehydrogenase
MKGLIFNGEVNCTPILRNDLPKPVILKDYALIKVIRAGICRTDIEMIQGYKSGFEGILGHEFVGFVEDVATSKEMKQTWLNQRVVGEINISCNECQTCLDGWNEDMKRNHCPNRSCLGIIGKNGTFAEYITLPIRNLYMVPDSISDAHAVFVEPLAAAYRIIEQNIIQENDKICIIGDGKLGLLTAEVLVHAVNKDISITMMGKYLNKLHLGNTKIKKYLV